MKKPILSLAVVAAVATLALGKGANAAQKYLYNCESPTNVDSQLRVTGYSRNEEPGTVRLVVQVKGQGSAPLEVTGRMLSSQNMFSSSALNLKFSKNGKKAVLTALLENSIMSAGSTELLNCKWSTK